MDWEDWDGDEIATYLTRPHASCCPWDERRIYLQEAKDQAGVTWYRWRNERTDGVGPPSKDREAVIREAKAEAALRDERPSVKKYRITAEMYGDVLGADTKGSSVYEALGEARKMAAKWNAECTQPCSGCTHRIKYTATPVGEDERDCMDGMLVVVVPPCSVRHAGPAYVYAGCPAHPM